MGRIPDSRSDRALLLASRAGDGGFEEFYRRHCRAVLAFHGARVREPELAADLTAETFAAALIAVRDPARELPETPVAWLFTLAHNKFVDSYRRGRVEDDARSRLAFERMEITHDAAERIIDAIASTDVLSHLSHRLPADQFQALRARVIEDRDYSDIAHEMECSKALVRVRVSRALNTLRAAALQAQPEAQDG
jgi:RNA polymerase sigma factor (sigma-70 family)